MFRISLYLRTCQWYRVGVILQIRTLWLTSWNLNVGRIYALTLLTKDLIIKLLLSLSIYELLLVITPSDGKYMMRTLGHTQEITYLRREKVQFEIWYSKTQFKAILPLSHTWL